MMRIICVYLFALCLALPSMAQEVTAPEPDRSATGGAQTLEDIMRRQEGLKVDNNWVRWVVRPIPTSGARCALTARTSRLKSGAPPRRS